MANKEQFYYELKMEGLLRGSKSQDDYGKGLNYIRRWKPKTSHRVYEGLLKEYLGL